MSHDDGHAIIIVSDFHLSAGRDPGTGRFDRNEHFFHDAAFARFVDDLLARAFTERRRWRLVVLGDLFDFLRVRTGSPAETEGHSDTSEEATIAKLERIAAGHPEFFEALGRFVSAGFLLDIVPGNHDIELMRRSAQERFKDLVARFGGRPEAVAHITFHPWIFNIPGVLYAEHGHQYHDMNAFATLLRPYSNQHSNEIDLPLGSHVEAYLSRLIESVDPFGANVTRPSRYLWRAFRIRPSLALRTLPRHARFMRTVLSHMRNLSSAERASRRAAYHEEVLRPYSTEIGLSHGTVVAVDGLSMVSSISMTSRLARQLVCQPVSRALWRVDALRAVLSALGKATSTPCSLTITAASTTCPGFGKRARLRPPAQPRSYLFRAALAIDQLLRDEDKGVPYYVFGHAHAADQIPLIAQAVVPCYMNSGSWLAVQPSSGKSSASRERFTLVQITRDVETSAPVASLLLWNDAVGRRVPFPHSEP